jgi:hypothetical protein
MGLTCLLDPKRLGLVPATFKMHGPGGKPSPKQCGFGMFARSK